MPDPGLQAAHLHCQENLGTKTDIKITFEVKLPFTGK